MKRFIFILLVLVSINTLADNKENNKCNFLKQRDNYLEKIIKKLKNDKKIEEILCDSENIKMTYYLIDRLGYSLNLGVKLNITLDVTQKGDLRREFYSKLEYYDELFNSIKSLNKKNSKESQLINIRFYGFIENNNRIMYFGRYELDNVNNTKKFIGYEKSKEILDEWGIFEGFKMEYSSDEEFIL